MATAKKVAAKKVPPAPAKRERRVATRGPHRGTTGHKIDPQGVNHPRHYNVHPSGIECIDVVEHMSFNCGNAVKYVWREGEKGYPIADLKKAIWYLQREVAKREKAAARRKKGS